jgi:YD repeat-containing protein
MAPATRSRILPYDPADPRHNTPQKVIRSYDEAGRLTRVSAPPSQGQSTRVDTAYTYFDNGWVATSTDAWDIVTSYDYDALGDQTRITRTSAGGASSRTMTTEFYPDGKQKSRSDGGVPVGLDSALVDNSDTQNVSPTGTWTPAGDGTGFQGFDFARHDTGVPGDAFTWRLNVPSDGKYDVSVRYPTGGTATNAKYTVKYRGGEATKQVDQTHGGGQWVSLGSFDLADGTGQAVTVSADADGAVLADAVRIIRDNSGDVDTEEKSYGYSYDANGNLTTLTDHSSGAVVDTYAVEYTGLNQIAAVREKKGGDVLHTTSYTYNGNGDPLSRTHDGEIARYEYDARDLVSKVTNATSATDASPKVTTYTYDARGKTQRQTRGNGNTVDYTYYLDGLLREQTEKKSDVGLVSQHTIDYDVNGNRAKDTSRQMNADDHGAFVNRVQTYTYDPKDRVATVTKTDPGTGNEVDKESYVHDANDNVVSQTINGTTTTDRYDRNRLASSTTDGVTSGYNYDPFGRLDTVVAADQVVERFVYDGFDRTVEHRTGAGPARTTSRYTYDPLDRQTTKTDNAGTGNARTTTFSYLGRTGGGWTRCWSAPA